MATNKTFRGQPKRREIRADSFTFYYALITLRLYKHNDLGANVGHSHHDDDIQSIIENAKKTCVEEGVKLTPKRENILIAIIKAGEAVSAYELAEVYRELYKQPIPAMSVYRILDFLVELSLVHKLTSANKYIACSHITCSHNHEIPQFLICEECQSVTEIGVKNNVIEELRGSVEKTGFKLTTQQLELKGICANCQ